MTVPSVRRATAEDAEELTRLRILMMTELGRAPAPDGYAEHCAEELRRRVSGEDFVAYVVDRAGGGLVACGCGWIDQHLPSYRDFTGRVGYIGSMSTDADSRGRGYAGLIVACLLDWFRAQGLARVDLHASSFGEPIYRRLGFAEHQSKGMTYVL